jgi:hypothetical protein
VRVELVAGDSDIWVQVTRDTVERLGLEVGLTVYILPTVGASTAVSA